MGKYKYSVALSFSGKQRPYVDRVSKELTRLGVSHFYDFNEQENLWGKDLARFLDKLYFEESEYFVPFISKEYAESAWPNLEFTAALDRNMRDRRPDYQRYILPVYFDDIRLDGVSRAIGYYDASATSPEALALAIYKKLNTSAAAAPTQDPPQISSTHFIVYPSSGLFENINKKHFAHLSEICDHGPRIVIVYGDKGTGKRTCISRYLLQSGEKTLLHIRPVCKEYFKYSSIIKALNLDRNAVQRQNDLDLSDYIKRELLSACARTPSVMYVEHFQEFDEASRRLLYEVAFSISARHRTSDIVAIIELDTDQGDELLKPFYEFAPIYTDFLRFDQLPPEDIRACFYAFCGGNVDISEANLNYILRSASGNIMYLSVIINYLKGAGYFACGADGRIVCGKLPGGALSDVLRKYLQQRYERLDDTLKELLSKSSIIGSIFQSNLLEKPFQIVDADEKLASIEKISSLIEHRNDQTYAFETEDVRRLIQSNVSEQQQKEWHNILALYFQRMLTQEQKRKVSLAIEKEISYVYPIAKHYKYAAKYYDALPYYLKLISGYTALCDYTNELTAIRETKHILALVDVELEKLDKLEFSVAKAEADCLTNLGYYENARELYEGILPYIEQTEYSEELIDLKYNMAYCLYMMGKVGEAQQELYKSCDQFELRTKHRAAYIHLATLLASICDSTNDRIAQKRYYAEALTYYRENGCETEYHKMLRMSSMVYGEVLALDMEKTAEKYFRNHRSIRLLAETLHNLATDELYLLQEEHMDARITECISLFDSFGSRAVHYPLNTRGVIQMVRYQDFQKALLDFDAALQMSTEAYSEITIRTNMMNCFLKIDSLERAHEQLQLIDELIAKESSELVPVYDSFHALNWAFYFYFQKDYDACESYLRKFDNLSNVENRHRFIAKYLHYRAKKAQGRRTRNTAGTAPYPAYRACMEMEFYFATLRFYE